MRLEALLIGLIGIAFGVMVIDILRDYRGHSTFASSIESAVAGAHKK